MTKSGSRSNGFGGGRPLLSTVVEIDLVGQISGGVRLGADARRRGSGPSTCARRLLGVEPYESNVSNWPIGVGPGHASIAQRRIPMVVTTRRHK
jgi:hypothetical protein